MARLARALSHGVASRHAASALKHQTAPLLRPAGASQLSTPACRLHMNRYCLWHLSLHALGLQDMLCIGMMHGCE